MLKRDSKGRFVKNADIISGYKGFRRVEEGGEVVGRCLNKTYKAGNTYKEAEAELCRSGMHFCTDPLDVFLHYPPVYENVYAQVSAESTMVVGHKYSKVCTKSLTVGSEFMDPYEYARSLKDSPGCGKRYVYDDSYAIEGYCIADKTASVAWVDGGLMKAVSFGDYSLAVATASDSVALVFGQWSRAAVFGLRSTAIAYGMVASADAVRCGSTAIATGWLGRVRGVLRSFLVAASYDEEGELAGYVSAKVDGKKIKANTWYHVVGGEFVEVKDARD